MKPHLWVSLMTLSLGGAAQAQLAFNGSLSKITFDASVLGVGVGPFLGGGFSPVPAAGQLDSDAWSVVAGGAAGEFVVFGGTTGSGTALGRGGAGGGVVTGGVWAFDVDPTATVDRALGVQPNDTLFTPGYITLRIQNKTGDTLTSLTVGYDVYLRNDQATASSFGFSYSQNDTAYTPVPSLNLTSPAAADAAPAWTLTSRGPYAITSLNVHPDGFVYLRWTGNDASGIGARDEFALDNVALTPESRTLALLTGLGLWGFACARRLNPAVSAAPSR